MSIDKVDAQMDIMNMESKDTPEDKLEDKLDCLKEGVYIETEWIKDYLEDLSLAVQSLNTSVKSAIADINSNIENIESGVAAIRKMSND